MHRPSREASLMQKVIEHHTLRGDFELSGGGRSDTYIDLRSAWLCRFCSDEMYGFYVTAINRLLGYPHPTEVCIVGTGHFGAMTLATLRWRENRLLWTPKGHGVEWSGQCDSAIGEAIIVDDVVTTGGTVERLTAACEQRGLHVIGVVTAVPAR